MNVRSAIRASTAKLRALRNRAGTVTAVTTARWGQFTLTTPSLTTPVVRVRRGTGARTERPSPCRATSVTITTCRRRPSASFAQPGSFVLIILKIILR